MKEKFSNDLFRLTESGSLIKQSKKQMVFMTMIGIIYVCNSFNEKYKN